MPDQPNNNRLKPTEAPVTGALTDVLDVNQVFELGFEHVKPVPWYYKVLIKLLKPVYHVALWRRYKNAAKQGLPMANYAEEIDARFGHGYPNPPKNLPYNPVTPSTYDTSTGLETTLDTSPCGVQIGNMRSEKTSLEDAIYANAPCIWCHAVSLGETNTIAPMLKVFLQKGAAVWLTNTTQTGFKRAQTLFSEAIASKQLVHTFVPVDDVTVVNKFLKVAQPDLAMFVETELWATTLELLTRSSIPSVLVNGRLSQKSFERYQKFAAVSHSMMQNLSMIIAQDMLSAKRFIELGADAKKVKIADSLKWSTGAPIPHELLGQTQPSENDNLTDMDSSLAEFVDNKHIFSRPIWVAGSTHEGEEDRVIKAHQQLLQQGKLNNALLIIVPRHPERFDAVAELIKSSGLTYHRRSYHELISDETQVYLADTMGELKSCYALSDVAFIGGSLVNIGGHNPVEAASLAKPIIMGKYTQSCDEVVEALSDVGALRVVESGNNVDTVVSELAALVSDWLLNPKKAYKAGEKGQALVFHKSTAMQKQLQLVETVLLAKFSKSSNSSSLLDSSNRSSASSPTEVFNNKHNQAEKS